MRPHNLPRGPANFQRRTPKSRSCYAVPVSIEDLIAAAGRRGLQSAAVEATILARVAPHLPVAVPDWRYHDDELIAYAKIAGTPMVTLETGAPVWNQIDPAAPSDAFVESYARAIAALQAVPTDDLPRETQAEIRARLARAATLAGELISPTAALQARWQRFLGGGTWPPHLALVHGAVVVAGTENRVVIGDPNVS
jgi:aminoglycoside phosphotransferase (APT) family kinase protein